jgi:hypothetical protein
MLTFLALAAVAYAQASARAAHHSTFAFFNRPHPRIECALGAHYNSYYKACSPVAAQIR